MPSRKQPETLQNHSLAVIVDTCMEEWISNEYENFDIQKYLLVPPNVLDLLVNSLIDEYSRLFRIVETDLLSKFLGFLLTSRLSVLNLKCLVNHTNFIYHDDLNKLENLFLRTLPYMSNLTSISFQASGKRVHSLPICTDSMMKMIGSSCPNLKSLDISNTDVSDTGISYLIPSADNQGCPSISKLFLFECYASIEGVCHVLLNLPNLNYLGYKETGLAILKLHKDEIKIELNLKHLNNIGCASSSCWNMNQFLYCANLSRIISSLAPHLEQLKVRVADRFLLNVVLGPKVSVLHLLFSLENVTNTGNGLHSLLSSYGHQLTSLTLYCDVIQYSRIIQIGELCRNLLNLDIRCNLIEYSTEDFLPCPSNVVKIFFNLEKLCLIVRHEVKYRVYDEPGPNLPNPILECLPKLLNSTTVLRAFYFSTQSQLITDFWLEQILECFNPELLQSFMVEIPYKDMWFSKLNLTLTSVLEIIARFPNLKTLGNLAAWHVKKSEIDEIVKQNNIQNIDLNIISKPCKNIQADMWEQEFLRVGRRSP